MILITGANGFIGRHVTHQFAAASSTRALLSRPNQDFAQRFPSVEPIHELLGAAPEDKKLTILESAHIPARHEAFREILVWLDQYLGPV